MASDEKLKALDAAISNIEKQFGKGSIMKLGESNVNLNVESIPTGSLSLDIALGLGGVPRGKLLRFTDRNQVVRHGSITYGSRSSEARRYCGLY